MGGEQVDGAAGAAALFEIRHVTTYRYARPVPIGRHRLMFRPRDSHDLRLYSATLAIAPPASELRWLHDVFGNSVAIADFAGTSRELRFESLIRLAHYPLEAPLFPIEDYARHYPFSYAANEMPDLGRTVERHYPDPEHRLDQWARQFIRPAAGEALVATQPMLEAMTRAIRRDFRYGVRLSEGTQAPLETLDQGGGSCRDLALLMIEAARSLGLAARFVSGYQYDPARDPGAARSQPSAQGGAADGSTPGSTHAWVQIYLPGAGWVEFDPTNGGVGGKNLIRVAVAREPGQALPLSGTWTGTPADYLGMEVAVSVRELTACDVRPDHAA